MILDAHTDLVAEATVSDDFQGFFALVEEGSKYPLVSETRYLACSNQYNLLIW